MLSRMRRSGVFFPRPYRIGMSCVLTKSLRQLLIFLDCSRCEHGRRLALNSPALVRIGIDASRSSILHLFARPENLPPLVLRRREQRFGCMTQIQIGAKIYDEQPVLTGLNEVSQHKSLRRDHCAINLPIKLHAKCRIRVAELQEVAMEHDKMRVSLPLAPIQSTGIESLSLGGIGDVGAHLL